MERPDGFYWIRYTPDSIWMPAWWLNDEGWFMIGVDAGLSDDDAIHDEHITEIGNRIPADPTHANL